MGGIKQAVFLGVLAGCVGCAAKPPQGPLTQVVPVIGLPPIAVDTTRPGMDVQAMPTAEEVAQRERVMRVPPAVANALLARRPVSMGYPAAAKAKRLAGHVSFRLIVSRDGLVEGLTVTESSDASFVPLATAAVQSWQYQPYILNGQPVVMDTTARVEFTPPK